jgi:hypothetical protein
VPAARTRSRSSGFGITLLFGESLDEIHQIPGSTVDRGQAQFHPLRVYQNVSAL